MLRNGAVDTLMQAMAPLLLAGRFDTDRATPSGRPRTHPCGPLLGGRYWVYRGVPGQCAHERVLEGDRTVII